MNKILLFDPKNTNMLMTLKNNPSNQTINGKIVKLVMRVFANVSAQENINIDIKTTQLLSFKYQLILELNQFFL